MESAQLSAVSGQNQASSSIQHPEQCLLETFAECSILFKFKEGEKVNHRNILDISRIKF